MKTTIDVPDELWDKFKKKATKEKTNQEWIVFLIEQFVKEGKNVR